MDKSIETPPSLVQKKALPKLWQQRWKHYSCIFNLGVILETDLSFSSHVKAVTKSAYYHLKNIARIRCFVSSQDFMPLSPAGWIIVMVSSPAFQRRPLDSSSSSRTLLPGYWLKPENLSISHQSSGPYTGFQLHLGLILKLVYLLINHSMT